MSSYGSGVATPRTYDQIKGDRPANTDVKHYDPGTGRSGMVGAREMAEGIDSKQYNDNKRQ